MSNSAKAEAGLSQKTIAGVVWSAFFPSSRQILSLLSVSMLARKVPPSAYGVISMAAVITNFLETVRDMGTSYAVIVSRRIRQPLIQRVLAQCRYRHVVTHRHLSAGQSFLP